MLKKLKYPWDNNLKEIKEIQKSLERKTTMLASARDSNSKTIAVIGSEINKLKSRAKRIEIQIDEICRNVVDLRRSQDLPSSTLTYIMMCGILSGITAAGFVALMVSSL